MTKELVVRKESTRYPGLFTVKYHNRVFYDNLWTDELKESRGRVELADGTVVVNPFTKVFNRTENNTDIDPKEMCIASLKINGFMAAATYVPFVDKVVVSTTGSLDSDFVAKAEDFITDNIKSIIKDRFRGKTLLFEVCHKTDPHIVPQNEGLYLIGIREVANKVPYFSTASYEHTLDHIAEVLGCQRTLWTMDNFENIVAETNKTTLEGVVVYGQISGTVLKLKSPYYLAMKAMARIKDINKLKREFIDEEFYPLIDHLVSIRNYYIIMEEQEKLEYLRNFYLKSKFIK